MFRFVTNCVAFGMNPFRNVLAAIKKPTLKRLIALLASLPAALFGSCNVSSSRNVDGGWDQPSLYWTWEIVAIWAVSVVLWIVTSVYAIRAETPRLAAARAFRALIVVIAVMPLIAVGHCVAAPEVSDPILPAATLPILTVIYAGALIGIVSSNALNAGKSTWSRTLSAGTCRPPPTERPRTR